MYCGTTGVPKQENIRFAIVGCGNIAPFHAKAIAKTPGAELSATCDSDMDKAGKLADLYSAAAFTDYFVMLRHAEIEVVNICLPSSLHEKFAIAAADAGKHVIVEKPLDITLDKCDNIISACNRNGVKLSVVFPNRFKKGVKLLKQAVAAGRFGKLTQADAQVKWFRSQAYYDSAPWRGTWQFDGGGVMINQAIHYVDILQSLMGPVESVSGRCSTLAHEIEVEDTAMAMLRFANGALGMVEASTAVYPGQDAVISIHGDKGSAVLKGEAVIRWEFADKLPGDDEIVPAFCRAGSSGAMDPVANLNSEGHCLQIADMVSAIRENRDPEVDGAEGRKAIEIIQAIYRSSRENISTITL